MDAGSKEIAPLLTITGAATFLNVSKATIRRWTDEGRLKCLRIGARDERRFRKVDLVEFVNKSESGKRDDSNPFPEFAAASSVNGAHQCVISNDIDEEWDTLGAAILTALDQGSQVLVIEVSDRKKRLDNLLKDKRLNKRQLLASRSLRCVSIEESYFLSGEFRWDRAVAFIESAILGAKAGGFEKILIIGADTGAVESEGHHYGDELKQYELALDAMLARHPNATVLCPYTASVLSARLMVQGFLTHPHMQIYKTSVPGLLGQMIN